MNANDFTVLPVDSHGDDVASDPQVLQTATYGLATAAAVFRQDPAVDFQPYPANIDLSTLDGSNGFKLMGEDGYSAGRGASAGDVNGDGFSDIVIGALAASPHGSLSGTSYIVSGGPAAFAASAPLSTLGSRVAKFDGSTAGANSGRSVSSAGDVNGDGYADVIIGSPRDDAASNGYGASYIIYGRPGGPTGMNLSSVNGITGSKIVGGEPTSFSGNAVSSAGDVNGDGFADVIIGASLASPHGVHSGAAYVVFGSASGFSASFSLSALNGINGFKLAGGTTTGAGGLAGNSVASAGDFNGDGFADVIVGAPASPTLDPRAATPTSSSARPAVLRRAPT